MQPMKEKLSSAAGLCAGRGCALIRQLANMGTRLIWAPHQAATVKESISICKFSFVQVCPVSHFVSMHRCFTAYFSSGVTFQYLCF